MKNYKLESDFAKTEGLLCLSDAHLRLLSLVVLVVSPLQGSG